MRQKKDDTILCIMTMLILIPWLILAWQYLRCPRIHEQYDQWNQDDWDFYTHGPGGAS